MKRTCLTLALAALFVFPGLAAAQDEQSAYIWVNYMKAERGQGDALTKLIIEEDTKFFNPLVDSGAALDWGLAMPVFHDGNDPYSHVEWIVFSGWAGADAFMGRFMELQQARSDEEKAAMAAKYEAAVVAGSHADQIWKIIRVSPGEKPPTYINLGFYTSKPGKASEAKDFYDDVAGPVYDKLKADGAITSYGLAEPGIHRNEGFTHMGWYSSENLATRDVVSAAFDAADAARSDAEKEAMGKRWMETFDPEGHEDQVLMVIHYYGGSEGGE